MSQLDLMQRLDFTAQDLEANHNGQISDRQKIILRHRYRERFGAYSVAAVFLAICVLYGLISSINAHAVLINVFLQACGYTLLSFCCLFLLKLKWKPVKEDITIGEADSVTGEAFVTGYGMYSLARGGQSYRVVIAAKSFPISKFVAHELEIKKHYRAFYARHSEMLLSVEPVSS